jgi:hypothetical protein
MERPVMPDDPVTETVKTVGKVAEAATQITKSNEKALAFLARVLKEPLHSTASIINNRLLFYKFKDAYRLLDKVNALLDARQLTDTRAVPYKIAIPIFEAGSMEDDEDLQILWAKLMANALDPNYQQEMRTAFISILRDLTARDVLVLQKIYGLHNARLPYLKSSAPQHDPDNKAVVVVDQYDICNDLEITDREYELSIFNLFRTQCVVPTILAGAPFGQPRSNVYTGSQEVAMTQLGIEFIRACMSK